MIAFLFPQFVHEFNLWSDFHSDTLPPRGGRAPFPSLTEHKETSVVLLHN